jgi:Zn-dependent peptidase ImmA (M78 family)
MPISPLKATVMGGEAVSEWKPYPNYRSSGIDFFITVPDHWEVKPLKSAVSYQEGPGIMASDFVEEGIPLLRINNLTNPIVSLDGCNFLDPQKVKAKWNHFRLYRGDLLISCSASTGIVSSVGREAEGAVPYTGIVRLSASGDQAIPEFIKCVVISHTYIFQIDSFKSGVAIQHYGPTHLARVILAFPPVHEQQLIADFLNEPPAEEIPVPFFSTLEDEEPIQPSPELLDTIHAMQRRQAWMREHSIQLGHDALRYVGSLKNGDPPEAVAQCMREVLGVREDWASEHASCTEALKYLRESMEDAGIIVVVNGVVGNNTHRKLEVSEFRGFVLVDEYAPLAFVNGSDAKAAQMFTLAHELAHVCHGSSAAFDLREVRTADDPMEQRCNKAAAEFLVPTKLMMDLWQTVEDKDKPFESVARTFKVSGIVAARRALDLGLITKKIFLGVISGTQEEKGRSQFGWRGFLP